MESLIFPTVVHLLSPGVGIQAQLCLNLEPEVKLPQINMNNNKMPQDFVCHSRIFQTKF